MFNSWFGRGQCDDGVRYISNITRSISMMIDLVMLICILVVLSHLTFALFTVFYSFPVEEMEKLRFDLGLTDSEQVKINIYYTFAFSVQLIQLIAAFLYLTVVWCKFGTTPGKFLFGVRIVDADTFQKITFKQASIRFFSVILSIIPVFLGVIWSIFDKRSQTWHDKIANTVLIVKDVE